MPRVDRHREVSALLRSAADLWDRALGAADPNDRVASAGSAAWRVADAGALMRHLLEAEMIGGVGVTVPTGRGATLPTMEA